MTNPTNTDSWQAFQEFERDGWNDVATVYAELIDHLGLTTGQAGAAIFEAAGLQSGESVADVATGPGFLARLAADRGAEVIGIDIAAAMVEEARRRHPQLRFEVGPAERLPLPGGSFDVIVFAWGLPHFADHGQVFLEARRVLRPGGRLAFATWRPPPGNEFFAILLGSLRPYQQHATGLPPGPACSVTPTPPSQSEILAPPDSTPFAATTSPSRFTRREAAMTSSGSCAPARFAARRSTSPKT